MAQNTGNKKRNKEQTVGVQEKRTKETEKTVSVVGFKKKQNATH